jgi:hypothetical protein
MNDNEMIALAREAVENTKVFHEFFLSVEGGALVMRFTAASALSAAGLIDAAREWLRNEMQVNADFALRFVPPFKPAREMDGNTVTLRWGLA